MDNSRDSIFTNQISTSNHGIRKKQKTPGQEQEKKMSRVTVQRKKKKVFWVKKKKKKNPIKKKKKKNVTVGIRLGVLSRASVSRSV